jgi:hypothetical protein
MLCLLTVNRLATYAKQANVTQAIYDIASCPDYKVINIVQ